MNRVFFCHDSRQKDHELRQEVLSFPPQQEITIRDILSWIDIFMIRHYVTHAAPTVSEGRYWGMTDSALCADCRERATPQRSRWARANEHAASSKPRGEGDTARRNSEDILRISRARPGRRPVRLETRWPGRAGIGGIGISQTWSGLGP